MGQQNEGKGRKADHSVCEFMFLYQLKKANIGQELVQVKPFVQT